MLVVKIFRISDYFFNFFSIYTLYSIFLLTYQDRTRSLEVDGYPEIIKFVITHFTIHHSSSFDYILLCSSYQLKYRPLLVSFTFTAKIINDAIVSNGVPVCHLSYYGANNC